MTIKHLVISGGGPSGFITYGAAKLLSKEQFWSIDDIKTIYGCSIGAYMGVILSLKYDWNTLDDYFIKRPWEKIIELSPSTLVESYLNKGIIGESFIKASIEPLLTAKNLEINITMKELYEYNNIEIHIYATNINSYNLSKIDISYKTHPDIELVKALCMTTAYPFAFQPVMYEGDYYIDGGMLNNYPLDDCIKDTECKHDEILSFKNIWIIQKDYKIEENSNIFDYLFVLLRKMQRYVDTEPRQINDVKYTVRCLLEDLNGIPAWYNAVATEDMRSKLITKGVNQGNLFLSYVNSQ